LNIIHLARTASTNTYLLGRAAELPDDTVVLTERQTAGRGQRGNAWESEPHKNLTFSQLFHRPPVPARQQFAISQAVSIAIARTLRNQLALPVTIKWPNDIYVGDGKLAGILIESSLAGTDIAYSVVGVGLNVNQTEFVSDAPNPVSLAMLTGRQYDRQAMLHSLCTACSKYVHELADAKFCENLRHDYLELLYRNDGHFHTFMTPDGTRFQAAIEQVAPDGTLTLHRPDGTSTAYAFQQVKHVIQDLVL